MNTLLVIFNNTVITQQTQENIVETIKQQGNWARLSPNAWLVKTDKTSASLRDDLMNHSLGTRITVLNVTGDGWGTTYSDEVSNWMKENV